MKALVYRRYGSPDVIETATVPAPRPGPRDVVVQVHTSTVNSGDARLRAARFPLGFGFLGRLAVGWSKPRQTVLGVDFAGKVLEVGAKVTHLAVGDRVVGMTGARMGSHAEQVAVRADHCVVRIPDGVSMADAVSTVFGGTTAMTYLITKARLQPSERVLVIGAAGAVGAASVQVARLLGASVTGVCSEGKADLVRDLGASSIIDYTKEDPFARTERWDVVIDTIGAATVAQCRHLATPSGRIGCVASGLPAMLLAPWVSLTSRQRLLVGPADESPAHVEQLMTWLSDGSWMPVIDRRLPWTDGADAHALVDSGRKKGSVVLDFAA